MKSTIDTNQNEQISVKEIIIFLLNSWKVILISVFTGILCAVIHIWVTPKMYEASAQIQMAQFSPNNTNPWVGNLEDPKTVTARMKIPTIYTKEDYDVCGIEFNKHSEGDLAERIKITPLVGAASGVELKITMNSRELAVNCVNQIFKKIYDYQYLLINPSVEDAKLTLLKNESRIKSAKDFVAQIEKMNSSFTALYFYHRDEIKFLQDENFKLKKFISAGRINQAKMLAPVYSSNNPVSPKKRVALQLGAFVGLMIAFLIILLTKIWINIFREK